MLNINNNIAILKRDILVKITKLFLSDKLIEEIDKVPIEVIPRDGKSIRCCIYKDRAIVKTRVIARLGMSVENTEDSTKTLADYAKEALEREKPTWPMLTVLDEACNACVRSHYMVTNACQTCLARPCMMNCPRKCIEVGDTSAKIDEEKCINCGICANNCPYKAIIKVPIPCEEACPVGAITKDENGKERINYHKCTFCGHCMTACPFGAMMDKSQIIDVVKHIKNKKQVIAIYAPAIATQFKANIGQLETAFIKAGFSDVVEVALGADTTSDKEAHEFIERILEHGDKLMTTSCCPAYVRAVRRHVPDLEPCISETKTPMYYTAEMVRKEYPDSVIVFIGPCLAKRREGMDHDFVNYVMSVEELNALFIAVDIDITKQPQRDKKESRLPTFAGRNFATSGGVAKSIEVRLKDPTKLKAAVINGLDREGMKQLQYYGDVYTGKKEMPADFPNLVEVMACNGGCVAGPCVIINPKTAQITLKKYSESGKEVSKVE